VTVTTTFKSGGDTIVTYKVARMPSTARFRRAFSLATADTYPVTVDRGRTDTHTHTETKLKALPMQAGGYRQTLTLNFNPVTQSISK